MKPSFAWVAVAVLLVFGPLTRTPWLWDDKTLLRDSPVLADSTRWLPALTEDFWRISVNPRAQGMYRPLVTASYFADRALFGTSPLGPHVVNLLLHLLCAWLLYRLALRRQATAREALLASAFFSLHPACVEAVANVSSRGDLLATVLLMAAFLALERHLAIAALLTLAAQLSKESAFVALPLALLLEARAPVDRRRLTRVSLALGSATALAFIARHFALHSALRLSGDGGVVTGLSNLGRYAARVVFPSPLVPYQPDTVASWAVAGVMLALGFLSAWLLRARPQRREGALAWAFVWLALATAPVCNWLPVHARFSGLLLYLPLTGVALGVARALQDVRVAPVLPMALAALSLSLSPLWRDDEALWRGNVETFPLLAAPALNYANALAARAAPETPEAYAHAVGISKASGDTKSETLAEFGWGTWLLQRAPVDAELHFASAQRAAGFAFWQAGLNRAVALALQNRRDEAEAALDAQYLRTPELALAEAGVQLSRERGDNVSEQKWRDRASLTRPKK